MKSWFEFVSQKFFESIFTPAEKGKYLMCRKTCCDSFVYHGHFHQRPKPCRRLTIQFGDSVLNIFNVESRAKILCKKVVSQRQHNRTCERRLLHEMFVNIWCRLEVCYVPQNQKQRVLPTVWTKDQPFTQKLLVTKLRQPNPDTPTDREK